MWRAMASPAFDFQGDPAQQGGTFILGPGKTVLKESSQVYVTIQGVFWLHLSPFIPMMEIKSYAANTALPEPFWLFFKPLVILSVKLGRQRFEHALVNLAAWKKLFIGYFWL